METASFSDTEMEWVLVCDDKPRRGLNSMVEILKQCVVPYTFETEEKEAHIPIVHRGTVSLSQQIPFFCDVNDTWKEFEKKVAARLIHTPGTHIEGDYKLIYYGGHNGIKIEEKEETQGLTELEIIFAGLTRKWHDETGGYALTYRRYAHHSYQSILVLGDGVVPLILRELQRRPDRWFEALKALTEANPAAHAKSFDESVALWLKWGKDAKLID